MTTKDMALEIFEEQKEELLARMKKLRAEGRYIRVPLMVPRKAVVRELSDEVPPLEEFSLEYDREKGEFTKLLIFVMYVDKRMEEWSFDL